MSILVLIGINILPLIGKTCLMNSNTISVLVQPIMKAVMTLELGTTTIQSCTTERELQVDMMQILTMKTMTHILSETFFTVRQYFQIFNRYKG